MILKNAVIAVRCDSKMVLGISLWFLIRIERRREYGVFSPLCKRYGDDVNG